MSIPVGLNVWSRLVEQTFPYLDNALAPFDSLWIPDHVQNNGHKVGEGWTLLSFGPGPLSGQDRWPSSFMQQFSQSGAPGENDGYRTGHFWWTGCVGHRRRLE